MKKYKQKPKSTFSKPIVGCGISGKCEGICAEKHGKDCPIKYVFKWEFSKKYRRGRAKVYIEDIKKEKSRKRRVLRWQKRK